MDIETTLAGKLKLLSLVSLNPTTASPRSQWIFMVFFCLTICLMKLLDARWTFSGTERSITLSSFNTNICVRLWWKFLQQGAVFLGNIMHCSYCIVSACSDNSAESGRKNQSLVASSKIRIILLLNSDCRIYNKFNRTQVTTY